MNILTIQSWQEFKRSSSVYLLASALIGLTGCENVDYDAQFDDVPPPNFTRGLLVRNTVEPLYPMRAENLGIEGWVMLRFSVNEDGQVMNSTIEIIEEQPPETFVLSAITAARRLTFENTRGQVVEDVRYVFRYELDKSTLFRPESRSRQGQFRELIPNSFITPRYPPAALQQSIEGYVIVKFTVTESGATEDIVISESEPAGVFDQQAIAAASRLRFVPRLVFSLPVPVEDVLYRFDWRLPQ